MRRALLVLLTCGGCELGSVASSGSSTSVIVRDSAGIGIVENTAPVWGPQEAWVIDPVPMLEIGVVDGDQRYQFAFPFDVLLHADGRVAVSDQNTIRIFSPEGGYLTSIGRRGQGPGEFAASPRIKWMSSDTLVAWDPGSRRMSWFLADGSLVRSLAMESTLPVFVPQQYWQVFADSGLLAVGTRTQREETSSYTRMRIELLPHLIASLTGVPVALEVLQGEELLVEPATASTASRSAIDNPFNSSVTLAVREEPASILVASAERWELKSFEPDGSLRQIVRAAVPRTPVSPEMLEAEHQRVRREAENAGDSGEQFVELFRHFEVPDSLPAIDGVHVDRLSNIWVIRRTELSPSEGKQGYVVDILDRTNRWLGTVTLPEGMGRVRHIASDHIATTWEDELGVQYVRIYRVRKSGS